MKYSKLISVGLIESTTKGFLMPRLTILEKNSINNPAEGLVLYNTDYECMEFYNGSIWDNASGCDFSKAFTFVEVSAYNGISSVDSVGMGFYNENMNTASTIQVTYNSIDTVPYSFKARDMSTGLIYEANGVSSIGNGLTVTLVPTDTLVTTTGVINMVLNGANNTFALDPRIDVNTEPASNTVIVDIPIDTDNDDGDNKPLTCGGNGCEQIWMDRNLGAHNKATALNDISSYGNLFQWGRLSDGHELVVVADNESVGKFCTTNTIATSINPGNNLFVLTNTNPLNWLNTLNHSLWISESSTNNPCPSGYRVPTRTELVTMISVLNIGDANTAVNSPLAIPSAGLRRRDNGVIQEAETNAYLWTLNDNSTSAQAVDALRIRTGVIDFQGRGRAFGMSVRCIKN